MDFLHRDARCDTQTIQHCLNHDSVLSSAVYELNRISEKYSVDVNIRLYHWYINVNNAKEYDIA